MRLSACITYAIISLIAIVSVASGGGNPDTARIRVRILRAWNGKPWKGIKVSLCGITGPLNYTRHGTQMAILACEFGNTAVRIPNEAHDVEVVLRQQAVTDSTGVATFEVNQPLPSTFLLNDGPGQIAGCSEIASPFRSSAEVMQSGTVDKPAAWCKVNKGLLDTTKPVAGEIVIFALRAPWI